MSRHCVLSGGNQRCTLSLIKFYNLNIIVPASGHRTHNYSYIAHSHSCHATFSRFSISYIFYRNPTPNNYNEVEWRNFTLEHQEYLNIGNVLTSKSFPEKEEITFWDTIYKKYFPEYFI